MEKWYRRSVRKMNIDVVELKAERDLKWNFEGDGRPYFSYKDGDYSRYDYVDPFPAYGHNTELVRVIAVSVAQAFPIPQPVTFYLTDRECTGRTNGYTSIGYIYNNEHKSENERPWTASIVLSAKRIPIHPAMTSYLVAHEYGHVISKYLRWTCGKSEGDWYAEYAKLRGIESPKHYGGGTWHLRTEEIFANDFRYLITRCETGFWPHPTVPLPDADPNLVNLWLGWQQEALDKYLMQTIEPDSVVKFTECF